METALKKECNRQGGALLLYKLLMNACVIIVMTLGILRALMEPLLSGMTDPEELEQVLRQQLQISAGSGWGYLMASAMGLLLLLLWKKPSFFHKEIMKQGRPMGFGSFVALLCIFMSGQLLSQMWMLILDACLAPFGKSMTAYMENAAAIDTDTLSMFLYVGLVAPIFEELLFRGLVMRSLEPYGKGWAILLSSLLFGLYHGNPVQIPYAALIGVVLGYIAMEHNIVWAMVLHMFNNLIFADSFPRLLQYLPLGTQKVLLYGMMVLFALMALFMLLIKYRQVAEAIRRLSIHVWQCRAAWRSPLLLIFAGICVLDTLIFLLMVMTAQIT